jgi:tetratricopeptide (TPR) repeat protein
VLLLFGSSNVTTTIPKGQGSAASAEQAKALALTIDAKNTLAASIFAMGIVYQVTGKLEEATRFWQESLSISRETQDKSVEGLSLQFLGFLHNFKGEYELALQLQEQGFTSGQAHNLHYLLLWTLWTRSLTRCGKAQPSRHRRFTPVLLR